MDPLNCQGGLGSDSQLRGGAQALQPQEAAWRGALSLPSLAAGWGPRGLLSPLLEGKSAFSIEMTLTCTCRGALTQQLPVQSPEKETGVRHAVPRVLGSAEPWLRPEDSIWKTGSERISEVSH